MDQILTIKHVASYFMGPVTKNLSTVLWTHISQRKPFWSHFNWPGNYNYTVQSLFQIGNTAWRNYAQLKCSRCQCFLRLPQLLILFTVWMLNFKIRKIQLNGFVRNRHMSNPSSPGGLWCCSFSLFPFLCSKTVKNSILPPCRRQSVFSVLPRLLLICIPRYL